MTGWVTNEAIKLMDILSGRGKLPVRWQVAFPISCFPFELHCQFSTKSWLLCLFTSFIFCSLCASRMLVLCIHIQPGSSTNDHKGNICFLDHVRHAGLSIVLAADYSEIKKRIAWEIMDAFKASGDQFLKEANDYDKKKLGFSQETKVWCLMLHDKVVLEKVKQALCHQNTTQPALSCSPWKVNKDSP
jgi:hypothetical protein